MLFALKPSRTYVLMLLAAHLAAATTIFLTNLPAWARICLVLLIAVSLSYQWHRHLHASWQSFFLEQRHLRIMTRSGFEAMGMVLDRTVVIPFCVVLCAKLDGARLPVCQMIFKDALQTDAHRELRVRLKYAQ